MAENFTTDRLAKSLEDIKHVFNLNTMDIQDNTNAKLDRIPARAEKAAIVQADRTGYIDTRQFTSVMPAIRLACEA